MKHRRISLPIVLLGLMSVTTAAQAGTVENLERERALALEASLSPDMSPSERESSMEVSRARLVDLERMVMRDGSLKGRNTPAVRNAFQNYDLTFLVHASIEKNRTLIDHWLEQVGVTTNSLMSARVGRR
jgi:hypothetical protein